LDSRAETLNLFKSLRSGLKKHERELKLLEEEKQKQRATEAKILEEQRKTQALIEAQAKQRAEEAEALKSKTA
jgi:hypothetical protein